MDGEVELKSGRRVSVGNVVTVLGVPERVRSAADELCAVHQAIVGHRFRIQSIRSDTQWVELNVTRIAKSAVGGMHHFVWLEKDLLA